MYSYNAHTEHWLVVSGPCSRSALVADESASELSGDFLVLAPRNVGPSLIVKARSPTIRAQKLKGRAPLLGALKRIMVWILLRPSISETR